MTKHTPAPWIIGVPKIGTSIPIYGPKREYIPTRSKTPRHKVFNVATVSNNKTFKEGNANAALISAAPDYYEACKDLPQIIDDETTTAYDKRVLQWFYCNAGKIYAANKKVNQE